jgi:hypothetical protein
MGMIMADYSERVLAEVCGEHGICTKENFFPTIAKLKAFLDEEAFNQQEYARRETLLKYRKAPDLEYDMSDCYQGRIEDIQPGDKLNSLDRIQEYNIFIQKKGIKPKIWGMFEDWKDSRQRPFVSNSKKETNENPFL